MNESDLAEVLERERDRIVASFVLEVQRKELSPPGTAASLLTNHVPQFIDEMVRELRRAKQLGRSEDAIDTSATGRQHGAQRWNLGYDLDALIREHGVLRHCIIQAAKAAGAHISIDEFDVFAKCLSVGVAEAATQYIQFRDAQSNTQRTYLEFLAEAGQLLSSSLDYRSTLSRLTGLLVPRMADWCAIHLDGVAAADMPIAHVDPSKREALRQLLVDFPPPADAQHGHAHVVLTGKPEVSTHLEPAHHQAIAQSPAHLALLEKIDTCSLVIVPLVVKESTFGAMMLAYSDSRRHYGNSDLVLAGELARRAAVAIDNARLYELSQKERSRVEAATRAKDEFVAMVSHELRTPLNAILGWLRLMRHSALPASKQEHAFDVIERNANAQNQLVADLLDISRVITGKIRINPAEVDLATIVEMVVEGLRPAADAKQITIALDLERGAVLRGDPDRLQQIVWNLLSNAVKFTPKGGNVAVALGRVESDLELVVTDDGEGIPASFLGHVFDSFRQSDTSASRPHGGLGIGLSIVKHLVELHGGAIEARSEGEDRGATFALRLPTRPLVSTTVSVSHVPATLPPARKESRPADLLGVRVLVVDDEPDARELVAYVLETCGAEVHSAGSTAEALAALQSFTPHVIISDIGMPDLDGYALIRSVRTLAAAAMRNIPAIALTAFARNEDRTQALVAGFNMHMAKPVEPTALVSAVLDLTGVVRG